MAATGQSAASNGLQAHDERAIRVSLIQLIANPKSWDGKRVQVIGFLRLEFEGNALYLHREDYLYGITDNAVWISLPSKLTASQREGLSTRYVICEGVFRADDHGHLGLFSGVLGEINRIEPWGSKETVK